MAGHRLGALEAGGGGGVTSSPSNASLPGPLCLGLPCLSDAKAAQPHFKDTKEVRLTKRLQGTRPLEKKKGGPHLQASLFLISHSGGIPLLRDVAKFSPGQISEGGPSRGTHP